MSRFVIILGLCSSIFLALFAGATAFNKGSRSPLLLFHLGGQYDGDLYLYDLERGVTTRISLSGGREFEAVMTDDMRHIAYIGGNGTSGYLNVAQFVDGAVDIEISLLDNGEAYFSSPRWSPHANENFAQLAFVGNITNESNPYPSWTATDIWVQDIPTRVWTIEDWLPLSIISPSPLTTISNSTRRQLTEDDYTELDLAWSPDGSQIAFTSIREGNTDIFILDVDGTNKNIRRVTHHLDVEQHPTWSPDGQWLAYMTLHNGNGNIHITNLATGESTQITNHTAVRFVGPEWSPDGNYIAYSVDWFIYIIRPDGSFVTSIVGEYPSWVP